MALSAVLLERRREIGGNVPRIAPLDVAPFQHVHESSVLEQCDLRRRRRIAGEVAARARRRVRILSREYGDQARGTRIMLNGERGRGPRIAGGATTDRVHHHQCRRTLGAEQDRKSTRLNSSHLVISYAVFCLKKKKKRNIK